MPDPIESLVTGLPTGMPIGAPVEEEGPALINLCELGPCEHYHELRTKLDAQQPLDGSKNPTYVQITRTCYPSPGIEFDIGEAPVRACSKWAPNPTRATLLQQRREAFIAEHPDDWAEFEKAWGGQ